MRIDDGRQVKAARAILGMTVQALADAAGLHKNSVLVVEAKKRIRRHRFDTNSGVARIERVVQERGVSCDMVDGQPTVRFATTPVPPKYRRRAPRSE
ncbi:hypothetical protein [Aureimonas leprariae]|uniref:HTH cro/C1-type domain-containing protein n=1 Tax=Plantimonas leprariae TaxID=2615207 RepID=A0A7V7PK51_9HYPH|nr:hypothetical protein [Aureimonas leprariae]KAB0676006.1 hypothetical protein F6X38_22350 [Aureimonas leprariae]